MIDDDTPVIEMSVMPQNYYGIRVPVNGVQVDDYIYVGDNRNARPFKVKEIFPQEKNFKVLVFDYTDTYTVLDYPVNSFVSVSNF